MQKKKSLGQYFLKSAFYLNAVTDAAEIKKGDTVVEIGPGDGSLTYVILARGARVVAIEKDKRLIEPLRKKFSGKNFEIIEGDALDFDISKLKVKKFKLAGNIPYYITGALFKNFLSAKRQPSLLVFLVQKEVAERIARSKKESILSLSVKAYGTPRYVKTVPRGAFAPPPHVDSAVLQIKNISRKNFASAAHEKKFFELVRAGFSQKRKLLKNNVRADLEKAGISADARAEDVSLGKWIALARLDPLRRNFSEASRSAGTKY